MSKLRNGFTLIETMVVLVISVLILGLTLTTFSHLSLNRLRDYFFWKRFQGQFELCENIAKEYRIPTSIMCYQHNKVVFNNPRIKDRVIYMPKNLSTARTYPIMINKEGYIPPKTLTWIVDGRKKLYQKFQLGWGLYNLDDHK